MRKVDVTEITKNVKEMCIEANHFLSEDMKKVFEQAVQKEKAPLGRQVLNQLKENLEIAGAEMIPICQDTGMAVIFMKVGQEVHLMPQTRILLQTFTLRQLYLRTQKFFAL